MSYQNGIDYYEEDKDKTYHENKCLYYTYRFEVLKKMSVFDKIVYFPYWLIKFVYHSTMLKKIKPK